MKAELVCNADFPPSVVLKAEGPEECMLLRLLYNWPKISGESPRLAFLNTGGNIGENRITAMVGWADTDQASANEYYKGLGLLRQALMFWDSLPTQSQEEWNHWAGVFDSIREIMPPGCKGEDSLARRKQRDNTQLR